MKQASSRKPRSAIWVQLGCNNSSRGFLRAPRVAIGAVKLQLVTSGRCTVTAEVASSSLVVPAILFKQLRNVWIQLITTSLCNLLLGAGLCFIY